MLERKCTPCCACDVILLRILVRLWTEDSRCHVIARNMPMSSAGPVNGYAQQQANFGSSPQMSQMGQGYGAPQMSPPAPHMFPPQNGQVHRMLHYTLSDTCDSGWAASGEDQQELCSSLSIVVSISARDHAQTAKPRGVTGLNCSVFTNRCKYIKPQQFSSQSESGQSNPDHATVFVVMRLGRLSNVVHRHALNLVLTYSSLLRLPASLTYRFIIDHFHTNLSQ